MNLSTLSGRVAVAIALGLGAIVLILWSNHGIWFDNPSDVVQRRMDIIGQLVVGIGTAALAIVTWASVYETQQVVTGEDLRFRQSRMPMVVLIDGIGRAQKPDKSPALAGKIRNDGDGAAQHVRVSLEAMVRESWQVQKIRVEGGVKSTDPAEDGGYVEGHVTEKNLSLGSYLKIGEARLFFVGWPVLELPASSHKLSIVNPSYSWTITHVTIEYTDVFGERFRTIYHGKVNEVAGDFEIKRPKRYR